MKRPGPISRVSRSTRRGLAHWLKQYGIKRKKIRFPTGPAWGYERRPLADAWERYLPPPSDDDGDDPSPPPSGKVGNKGNRGTDALKPAAEADFSVPDPDQLSGTGGTGSGTAKPDPVPETVPPVPSAVPDEEPLKPAEKAECSPVPPVPPSQPEREGSAEADIPCIKCGAQLRAAEDEAGQLLCDRCRNRGRVR